MAKGITIADEYNYEISDDLKKIATDELRETEATIQHALKSLRDWAEQNPRISSIRLDASFFLRFLRAKKYSIPMVQESIERYLLLRESYDGVIFKNLDFQLPNITELLNLGYIFACPKRDSKGRRIIITRPGVFDPSKYPNHDLLKIHGMTYETLMENEENQIRGFIHIVDCTGLGLSHMTIFTPKEALRIVKNAEKTLPMRHKAILGINVSPTIKFAVDFALSIVTEKMRGRIQFHTAVDKVDYLDSELLPKEYGGIIPMADMIEMWKDELKAGRETVLKNDKMAVHLQMYSEKEREGAVSALKQQFGCGAADSDCTIYGIQGSFRKLEVD